MIDRICIKDFNVSIDLDIKSDFILIGTSNSGSGKSYLFNKVAAKLERDGIDTVLINYRYRNNIDDIKNKDAVILVDNLEDISKDDLSKLLSMENQVIMFGRLNFNYRFGPYNKARLIVRDSTMELMYPYLWED